MTTNRMSMLVVLGAIAGFLAAVLFFTGDRPAQAQPAAVGTNGRYQISAWGSDRGGHGAFVIDTMTGDVFTVGTTGIPTVGGPLPNVKK